MRRVAAQGNRITWARILRVWSHVENDLHDMYGIDLDDTALMQSRTWRWLRTRISGLLTTRTSRTFHALVESR